MTDLLKEAIADAKAVREVALANAKLALEEAFTPRIQSMIATKLSEEAESEEEMTEGDDEWYMEGEDGEETMEEGDDEEMPVEEGDDEEPAMEEAEEEMPVEEGDDEETSMEEGDDEEAPAMEEGDDEDVDEDLMEIIRQLEEELDSSEIGKGDNKQPSKYASDDSTTDKKEKLVQLVEEEEEEAPAVEEGDEEEADIKEILRALREEDEESEMEEGEDEEPAMEEGEDEEKAEMEEKVNEAYAVIQFLREKLNEVNLLNSKLLFSNKLFRSYSLTESQKVTVIENFDRAGSLREVKLVYATLAESFKGRSMKTPKSTKTVSLKESFASKPQASTRPSKKILTESNQVADRFKKLAGLL
jgi:hypothetical protein